LFPKKVGVKTSAQVWKKEIHLPKKKVENYLDNPKTESEKADQEQCP